MTSEFLICTYADEIYMNDLRFVQKQNSFVIVAVAARWYTLLEPPPARHEYQSNHNSKQQQRVGGMHGDNV